MILRTPPLKRRAGSRPPESPSSGPQLVIYEDSPAPEPSHEPSEQMMCTYQCRQMVKSEFFDKLSSAEKQACDYQSKLEVLEDDFCKTEAERRRLREQFLRTEQELAAAKGREQALQEQLLKEVNDSEERIRKQLQACSELEAKLQTEMQLRKKAESAAAAAEEKAKTLDGKLSHVSQSIGRQKDLLNEELEHTKRETKLSILRISADLERMECRANNAEKESELLKLHLEDIQKRLNESLLQNNELERKLSKFSFQEVPSTDSNVLVKHLQDELRAYESEVREARKLRCSHENIEVLKEKLLEEKGKRERAETELLNLSDIQLNMKKLEDDLSAWRSLLKDIPGVSCAEDVPLKLGALQKEVVENMRKVGEAGVQLKQMEVALDAAELSKQNAEAEAALARERAAASKSEVKQIQSMLSAVTEERDLLILVIDEMTKQKSTGSEGDLVNGLQELESRIAKKECYIKELESNLSEQMQINSRQHSEIQLLTERLNTEARRMKSLEREGDRLRSEIAILESKLGQGEFSAANTKVLRMVNTLAVDNEAKHTIEALQSELQKTKERLQAIEELKGQSGDAGTLVDSYISGKIRQYKEQIATLEKREERYKTVFAERISVFRRACCELFGYKIVMDDHQRSDGIPVTRFMLQSIYAQSDDEKLEFEYESGNTNILANAYASQNEISRQVDIFIRKMNSIPAFTANLTVESFNKRTLS